MKTSMAVATVALVGATLGAGPAGAQTFTKLYDLGPVNQAGGTAAGMIQRGGIFYGTALGGGFDENDDPYYGTVFAFNPASATFTAISNFLGSRTGGKTDGDTPSGGLTEHNGLLYGVTAEGGGSSCGGGDLGFYGCGQVYSVDPVTGTRTTLYDFQGGVDGAIPSGTVTFVGDVLYGTTIAGGMGCSYNVPGVGGCGTVYSIDASGHEQVVHAFSDSPTDGVAPAMGLVYTHGLLYGVTKGGGTLGNGVGGEGTIYSINPATGAETQVFTFGAGEHAYEYDGSTPNSGLTEGNGLLYGSTYWGGRGNGGVVYQFDPATNAFSVVRNFGGKVGAPYHANGPVIYAHKRLYGVTQNYTSADPNERVLGAVYEINPVNHVLHVLATFPPSDDNQTYPNGANPVGRVTYYNGALYGTTSSGGQYHVGVIYKIVP